MSSRWLFSLVGLLAALAGTGLWLGSRPSTPAVSPGISASALFAASFKDAEGRTRSLGEFHGKLVVLNFWATWCAPCREEMPAFTRVQARWAARGVQFVGLSGEESATVAKFGRELAINYPLWTGGDGVQELSRRLGNRLGVLPFTVILAPAGHVLDVKVGPYTEQQLQTRLTAFTSKQR